VYNEEGLLNVLRGTAYPLAATGSVYIALYTAAPTDAGGGTEVSAGGYARQAVSKATGSWSAPSGTPRAMGLARSRRRSRAASTSAGRRY
jgi:hypothetical protein